MFPQTHALMGWLGGSAIGWLAEPYVGKKERRAIALTATLAALVPDIPYMIQIGLNLLNGLRPDEYVNPVAEYQRFVVHSIPLWTFLAALLIFFGWRAKEGPVVKVLMAIGFAFGGLIAHIFFDTLSHKGIQIPLGDYAWPSEYRLGELLGMWNYYRPNSLLPTTPEIVFDLAMAAFICVKRSLAGLDQWRPFSNSPTYSR